MNRYKHGTDRTHQTHGKSDDSGHKGADGRGGEEWRIDFDNEAGRLPKDLQRGVLSEDAVWNWKELKNDKSQTSNKNL